MTLDQRIAAIVQEYRHQSELKELRRLAEKHDYALVAKAKT